MDGQHMFQHNTYSQEQLQRYYDRISLPKAYREAFSEENTAKTEDALGSLTVLQKFHLAAIPFENLDLSYSFHHTVSIDAEDVFEKIVEQGAGRGGWCLELNCLFGTVLRSIGYDVYPTAGRVSTAVQPVAGTKSYPGPEFDPWNHMVLIVKCPAPLSPTPQRYLVDVGFGGGGAPISPIRLDPSSSTSTTTIAPQTAQLQHTTIQQTSDPAQKYWVYSHRNADDAPWTPTYAFTETEFLPGDFERMNYWLCHSRKNWMAGVVIVVRKIMDENEDIVGEVMLVGNEVKRRMGGKSEVLVTAGSERERVTALEEHFGIRLSMSEREGIRGLAAEIL